MVPSSGTAKTALPGVQVEYSLRITNSGNLAATFRLDLTGHQWAASAPATVGPLAAHTGSNTVTVKVTVAADALANATDAMTVTLTSLADPTTTAQTVLTTTAGVMRAAGWDAPTHDVAGAPDQSITVTLKAINTGNISDAYTITVTSEEQTSWPIQIPDQTSSLPPGDSLSIPVRVDVPAAVMPNESHTWTVSLTSQATGQVLASTSVRVTVQGGGHSVFLPHLMR